MRHFHDGLFSCGEVVAQVDQRGADVAELTLAGAHDVGELGNGRRSLVRAQILAGIAQVDHDAGEVGKMFRSHTQLTAAGHDFVDFVRARRNFGRHSL